MIVIINLFKKNKVLELVAPMTGKSIAINQVPDQVFASGMMGPGVAFDSNESIVYAPCSGKLTLMPSSKHAFGIKAANGAEVLVHIGLDTVNLNGEGFEALAKQDNKVKAGEPMIKFDRAAISAQGYNLITMLIVTNAANYQVNLSDPSSVKGGTTSVMTIK
ncbi:PTS glucose transporter subunit IIA [Lacticaseibacillus paracasei]|uniref:PTS sugar transporter subunit IIA n=1 Tax=Lacticaseibacillus paracasei TaxID=1597 RepID=UPI00331348D7